MLKIKLIVILMFACAMVHSQEISNLLGKWAVLDTLPLAVKYKIQLQEFNKARVLEIAKVDKAAIAQELAHPTKLRQSEKYYKNIDRILSKIYSTERYKRKTI